MERKAPPVSDSRPLKLQRQEELPTAASSTPEAAAPLAEDSKENVCSSSSSSSGVVAARGKLATEKGSSDTANGNISSSDSSSSNTSSDDSSSSNSGSKKEIEAAWAETEHKNWIVNTGVLYDVVMSIPLDWPSLTVQWLPGTTPGVGSSTVKQRLLVGTHTSGAEPDALVVFQVELPTGPIEDGRGNEFKERGDYEGFHFGLSSYKVKVVKRLPHPQESNCARYMPQRPSIIASCTVDGRVLLYDLDAAGICESFEASHTGHKGEATCVSWNPYREGFVASSGSGGTLAVHDASTALKTKHGTRALTRRSQ